MSQYVGPAFDRKDYAGFVRCSLALLIDAFLLGFLHEFVSDFWPDFVPREWVTEETYLRVEFGYFLFVLLYCFGFRLTQGGTPGYRLVRIRYAHMFNEKPTMLQRSYRAAITMFMIWGLFVIDHFWILFDERKQTWHDKVSGFYVVKCKAQPVGTQQVVQRIVNFMMLSLVVWEPVALARPVVSPARD